MRFLVGTDAGLFEVDSGGETVEPLGLAGRSVRAIHHAADGRLWGGTGSPRSAGRDGGPALFRREENRSWTPLAEGVIHQAWSIGHLLDSGRTLLVGALPPALFRSEDDGDSWAEVATFQSVAGRSAWTFFGGPDTAHVRSLSFSPSELGTVAAAIEVGGILVSRDSGVTWTDRTGPLHPDCHSVHLSRLVPSRLIATCAAGLFVSDDLGETWGDGPRVEGYFVPIRASADESVLYSTSVRDGDPVFRSSDGGATWEPVGADLPAPAYGADNLALDPDDASRLAYAGTVAGGGAAVFLSEDGGASWRQIAEVDGVPRRLGSVEPPA